MQCSLIDSVWLAWPIVSGFAINNVLLLTAIILWHLVKCIIWIRTAFFPAQIIIQALFKNFHKHWKCFNCSLSDKRVNLNKTVFHNWQFFIFQFIAIHCYYRTSALTQKWCKITKQSFNWHILFSLLCIFIFLITIVVVYSIL